VQIAVALVFEAYG
jgi:hypothetical protein